jgi:hypothetical protein
MRALMPTATRPFIPPIPDMAISLRVKLAGLDIHAVSQEEIAAGH